MLRGRLEKFRPNPSTERFSDTLTPSEGPPLSIVPSNAIKKRHPRMLNGFHTQGFPRSKKKKSKVSSEGRERGSRSNMVSWKGTSQNCALMELAPGRAF